MKKQVELINNPQYELIIRNFVFNKADTLRLTRHQWSIGCFPPFWFLSSFQKGKNTDPNYKKVFQEIQSDFIKKESNNFKYDDLKQSRESEHHYLKLSEKIKKRLISSTLLWQFDEMDLKSWYGYEDPTFYRDNKLICSVISHEEMVIFDLENEEYQTLKEQGIKFV